MIYHYSWMDNEVLDAVLEHGTVVCPSLTIIGNRYRFTQPTDGHGRSRRGPGKKLDDGRDVSWDGHGRRPDMGEKEWAGAIESARKAHAAGVTIMCGSDFRLRRQSVRRMACPGARQPGRPCRPRRGPRRCGRRRRSNASFLTGGDRLGSLRAGMLADFLAIDGDPLSDISVLLDKSAVKHIHVGGEAVDLDVDPPRAEEYNFSYRMWQEIYDRKTVAELAQASRLRTM